VPPKRKNELKWNFEVRRQKSATQQTKTKTKINLTKNKKNSEKFLSIDATSSSAISWIDDLPDILASLHLCFRNDAFDPPRYIIPCNEIKDLKVQVQTFWKEHRGESGVGRRISIQDETLMFHPAFLPQLMCWILSQIKFAGQPLIWQGGLAFETADCQSAVGLYMHGGFIAEKLKERMENRRHGEPERLQTLDILIKSHNADQSTQIMKEIKQGIEELMQEYWNGLPEFSWSVLLPATVQRYFLLENKKRVVALPLLDPALHLAPWSEIEALIISESKLKPVDSSKIQLGGFTPLHLAFHEQMLDLLQSSVGEAENITENGAIPTMLACQNGQQEALEFAMALGFEPDLRKSWMRQTALELAKAEGNDELVKMMKEYQRDPLKFRTEMRKKYHLKGNFTLSFVPSFPFEHFAYSSLPG